MEEEKVAEPIAQLQIDVSDIKETLNKTVGVVDTLTETVDQLTGTVDRMAIEIVNLQTDVADIKENIATHMVTKEEFSKGLMGQDKVIKMLSDMHTEMAATNSALLRHEGRIERLEDDVEELQTHLVIV